MTSQPNDPARFKSIVQRNAPEVGSILKRIADDMRLRPETMVPLSTALAAQLSVLTADVEFDPSASIEGPVDLIV